MPKFVRVPAIGLVIVVGLITYLISEVVGGADFADSLHVALTFDHINFIAVTTNLIFVILAMSSKVAESASRIIFWGVNIGLVGSAAGLVLQEDSLKRIFTPILGLALLCWIYTFPTAAQLEIEETVSV